MGHFMLRVLTRFTIAFLTLAPTAFGAIIRVADGSLPPPIVVYSSLDQPKSLMLEMFNETDHVVNVVVWQLDLTIVGLPGSVGELQIQSAGPPDDGLFDPVPGPIGFEFGGSFLVFDGDPLSETGGPIPIQTPKNIVELVIAGTEDVHGMFELRMNDIDPSNPAGGSSFIAAGGILPTKYDNAPSSTANQLLIGSILIGPTIPEPSSIVLALSLLAICPLRQQRQRTYFPTKRPKTR
jgi:hypothetical protein